MSFLKLKTTLKSSSFPLRTFTGVYDAGKNRNYSSNVQVGFTANFTYPRVKMAKFRTFHWSWIDLPIDLLWSQKFYSKNKWMLQIFGKNDRQLTTPFLLGFIFLKNGMAKILNMTFIKLALWQIFPRAKIF